jgi:Zn finger protein HypA/HybF involved in hydrogenase expression
MGVVVIDSAASKAGFVAGTVARGEFHCTECGYGITVHRALPACPMCRGSEWRPWTGRRRLDAADAADGHS